MGFCIEKHVQTELFPLSMDLSKWVKSSDRHTFLASFSTFSNIVSLTHMKVESMASLDFFLSYTSFGMKKKEPPSLPAYNNARECSFYDSTDFVGRQSTGGLQRKNTRTPSDAHQSLSFSGAHRDTCRTQVSNSGNVSLGSTASFGPLPRTQRTSSASVTSHIAWIGLLGVEDFCPQCGLSSFLKFIQTEHLNSLFSRLKGAVFALQTNDDGSLHVTVNAVALKAKRLSDGLCGRSDKLKNNVQPGRPRDHGIASAAKSR